MLCIVLLELKSAGRDCSRGSLSPKNPPFTPKQAANAPQPSLCPVPNKEDVSPTARGLRSVPDSLSILQTPACPCLVSAVTA